MHEGLSDGQALAALLATESFLLAVLSLAITLGAPNSRRQRRLAIPASCLAWLAWGILTISAIGAAAAWSGMYLGGAWRSPHEIVFATCLAFAIGLQPVLAGLVAYSSGWER